MQTEIKQKNKNKNSGFSLLSAVITTAMLLIVSFVVVNVAFKQLVISDYNKQSQYAFYAADSGTECATYWDLAGPTSPFATSTRTSISCGGTVLTPTVVSDTGSVSTMNFTVSLVTGCFSVTVTKNVNTNQTNIDSRGYNSCSAGASRRVERGETLTYSGNPPPPQPAPQPPPPATCTPGSGGSMSSYTSGGSTFEVHMFAVPGAATFVAPTGNCSGSFDYLIVAGGGGGGADDGGGGGAGGVLSGAISLTAGNSYSVTVGGAGPGGRWVIGNPGAGNGTSGTNSSFNGLTAIGGGGGGGTGLGGLSGGSGGGGNWNGDKPGGSGTSGQGNAGGTGHNFCGGGGGGYGTSGTDCISNTGGNGGTGFSSSIKTGSPINYAGGGGAGGDAAGGTGGSGVGGNGSVGADGISATGGTYGGGGGGGGGGHNGGDGGAAVVIIRYKISP